jgi:hypothetical protein
MMLKCKLAPQVVVAASDRVSFDVCWINDTNQTIRLPAITDYSLDCQPVAPGTIGGGGATGKLDFPTRLIAPHSTLHDKLDSYVFHGLRSSESVAISGNFYGGHQIFHTNTLVLRRP